MKQRLQHLAIALATVVALASGAGAKTFRIADQGDADVEPPLLATGELARALVRLGPESDQIDRLLDVDDVFILVVRIHRLRGLTLLFARARDRGEPSSRTSTSGRSPVRSPSTRPSCFSTNRPPGSTPSPRANSTN